MNPPEKPKIWKFKSGKRKGQLSNKAKKYLSFQLKQYNKTGLTREERLKAQIQRDRARETRRPTPTRKLAYYRTLIELRFRSIGKDYGNSGIVIWIYDVEEHSQSELIDKAFQLDRKYKIGINTGIKNKKVIYNFESEEVSKFEIKDFGNFNFLIRFPNGWSENGRI